MIDYSAFYLAVAISIAVAIIASLPPRKYFLIGILLTVILVSLVGWFGFGGVETVAVLTLFVVLPSGVLLLVRATKLKHANQIAIALAFLYFGFLGLSAIALTFGAH